MSPKEQWNVYREYLLMKIQLRDWKAAAIVCADILELEAEHPHLKPNPLVAKGVQ